MSEREGIIRRSSNFVKRQYDRFENHISSLSDESLDRRAVSFGGSGFGLALLVTFEAGTIANDPLTAGLGIGAIACLGISNLYASNLP